MSGRQWCRWSSHLAPANSRGQRTPLTNDHGLPVSPALQPRKQRPAREHQSLGSLTSFRKAVVANPYANALATPVRQCNFTGARLPSHHLLPFTTVFRGDQKDKLIPYLAPVDNSGQTSRAYALNSRHLLNRLGQRKNWQRLLGHDLKFGLKNRNDYQWPGQIEEIILSRLRTSVVRKLVWFLRRPNAKLVLPFDSAKECPSSACILYLGKESPSRSLSDPSVTEYHLLDLLGQELLVDLLNDTPYVETDALFLSHSYMTVSAHNALSRLSSFMSSVETTSKSPKT
ncbi:unnamed protein product [Aureobasidium uvarum]|uniref:Uncharacterized protein n=1 Tax=Aureobasidium uvarum TaxID=2773716 RepID=A0A9N8KNM5_9PEZI|nr:unnamed protein product [Aureobasidium uvarum]